MQFSCKVSNFHVRLMLRHVLIYDDYFPLLIKLFSFRIKIKIFALKNNQQARRPKISSLKRKYQARCFRPSSKFSGPMTNGTIWFCTFEGPFVALNTARLSVSSINLLNISTLSGESFLGYKPDDCDSNFRSE